MARSIAPAARLRGELRLPGDKSISHRALLFAAISAGETLIIGAGDGHDVRSTAGVARALGAEVERLSPLPDDAPGTARWRVRSPGRVGLSASEGGLLDCGNSGTTMRLGAGLVAGISGTHRLDGDASLRRRPMGRVLEPLRAMGATAQGAARDTAPLEIIGGNLHGITWSPTTPSAQVKGCVLIAGLAASGPTVYAEPIATRDHSERMLVARGARLQREKRPDGGTVVTVHPGALRALPEVRVPGDPSSAAFWLVAASVHPDADLLIRGVSLNPTRRHAIDLLRRMGALIDELPGADDGSGEPIGDLRVRSAALYGIDLSPVDVALAIDEIPILALAATNATGETTIRGAGELRAKESDRIAGVADGFAALGLAVHVDGNDLTIPGGQRPRGGTPEVRGDHRLAMTFAVAGAIGTDAVALDDEGAAAVSYPTFFADLDRVAGGAA